MSAFHNEEIRAAAWISLNLAFVATIVSTVFATAAALATTRTRAYRGMTAAYLVINQPQVVPEIITAIATLSFFALLRTEAGIYFGFGNLILAHTVFCIPFAYMPIRARLEDMDLTLEQAAADLYATYPSSRGSPAGAAYTRHGGGKQRRPFAALPASPGHDSPVSPRFCKNRRLGSR